MSSAYSALSERFIIHNANKTVAYTGGRGPRGVDTAELKVVLEKLVKGKKPQGSVDFSLFHLAVWAGVGSSCLQEDGARKSEVRWNLIGEWGAFWHLEAFRSNLHID